MAEPLIVKLDPLPDPIFAFSDSEVTKFQVNNHNNQLNMYQKSLEQIMSRLLYDLNIIYTALMKYKQAGKNSASGHSGIIDTSTRILQIFLGDSSSSFTIMPNNIESNSILAKLLVFYVTCKKDTDAAVWIRFLLKDIFKNVCKEKRMEVLQNILPNDMLLFLSPSLTYDKPIYNQLYFKLLCKVSHYSWQSLLNILKLHKDKKLVPKNWIVTYFQMIKWRVSSMLECQVTEHNDVATDLEHVLMLYVLWLKSQVLLKKNSNIPIEFTLAGDGWLYRGNQLTVVGVMCTTKFTQQMGSNDITNSATHFLPLLFHNGNEATLGTAKLFQQLCHQVERFEKNPKIILLGEKYSIKLTFTSDLKFLRQNILKREDGSPLQSENNNRKQKDLCIFCTKKRFCTDSDHWRQNCNIYRFQSEPTRQLKSIWGIDMNKCIVDVLHLMIRITGDICLLITCIFLTIVLQKIW